MRLLKREKNGQFNLTLFDESKTRPPYAILSHTWGPVDSEVTFDDIERGIGHDKEGYQKLEFCAEQARLQNLEYFWVDTCCIDKRSSPELEFAIASMFIWYQRADACYVYLWDVKNKDRKSAFSQSRWFTRGWTLQELLAPPVVMFYTQEGTKLGSRESRRSQIAAITGINPKALRPELDPSDFSVEERLAWGANRNTTRPADKAYCLLGIFGIVMSLRYSESTTAKEAMDRLNRKIHKKSLKDSQGFVGKIMLHGSGENV
jgi:hypothetical protein